MYQSAEQIKREVEFQDQASKVVLCPKIHSTDYKTYIKMDDLEHMCVADMYGDDFDDTPPHVKDQIYTILRRLYDECNIQYIDVTPYNFIEVDGNMWIIDFGDAKKDTKLNWYLAEVFDNNKLTCWNPDYR